MDNGLDDDDPWPWTTYITGRHSIGLPGFPPTPVVLPGPCHDEPSYYLLPVPPFRITLCLCVSIVLGYLKENYSFPFFDG